MHYTFDQTVRAVKAAIDILGLEPEEAVEADEPNRTIIVEPATLTLSDDGTRFLIEVEPDEPNGVARSIEHDDLRDAACEVAHIVLDAMLAAHPIGDD